MNVRTPGITGSDPADLVVILRAYMVKWHVTKASPSAKGVMDTHYFVGAVRHFSS